MLSNVQKEVIRNTSDEDFNSFFRRFQRDSLFRISRAIFPLAGYNSDDINEMEDDENNADLDYYWNKDEWKEYSKISYSDVEYKFKTERTDTLVRHTIYIPNSGFKVESEYKLIKHKWYLVYYFYQNL